MVLPLDIVTSGLIQNREARSAAEPDAGDSARLLASFHDHEKAAPPTALGRFWPTERRTDSNSPSVVAREHACA